MNIVMLCEFYDESLEFQENLLVKYYRRHGHAVTVLTSTFDCVFDYYHDRYDPAKPARSYEDHGARIIKLPYRYNVLNRLRAYTRIDMLLEEARPDLIYVHDIMPNLPEAIAYVKRHAHCRMILDYHADYSNSGNSWISLKILHGLLRKRFLDSARPHLSRIFPVVPASAVFLHEVYGVPYDEMEVLPLGADMDTVRRIRTEGGRAERRASLGIRPDEVVVFTGGKLTSYRQTEVLFEAVRLLPAHPIRVVVIGDADPQGTDYKEYLQRMATGRSDIVFTGWLDKEDVYRHMAIADLAVFPAGQSILWQQAIASGLPLIVGDVGSQDISYLNLADNIVILPREEIRPECFAATIGRVLETPGRLAAMASGARRVANEHLDWDQLIWRTLRYNANPAGQVEGVAT